jgi:hypothetical protein
MDLLTPIHEFMRQYEICVLFGVAVAVVATIAGLFLGMRAHKIY